MEELTRDRSCSFNSLKNNGLEIAKNTNTTKEFLERLGRTLSTNTDVDNNKVLKCEPTKSVEKDFVKKDSVRKDSVRKDSVRKDSVRKDFVEKDSEPEESVSKDSTNVIVLPNVTLHLDSQFPYFTNNNIELVCSICHYRGPSPFNHDLEDGPICYDCWEE